MSDSIHVLCVDDEPRLLEGLTMQLGRRFRVSTATSGPMGLQLLERDPPAVIVSDMRMPEMDGTVFLGHVRERSPDTVNILLAGEGDADRAIAAVNHGQIFRFLTKPCTPGLLMNALHAAAERYRLITAERVLLEQTLRGSVQTLTDVMALSSPLAFGRATRIKHHATDIVRAARRPPSWEIEVAAMLSQIGCITLPAATLEKLYRGGVLSPEENEMIRRLPTVAVHLLEHIPRLDGVIAIIRAQRQRFDGLGSPGLPRGEEIPLGARVLKIAVDYDALESTGVPSSHALETMRQRAGWYDPELLGAFARVRGAEVVETREIDMQQIAVGMVVAQDVLSQTGLLLVARGHSVSRGLVERLRNLAPATVQEPICVITDPEEEDYPPASILIVDDNPANLLALEAVLESPGHRVVKANSGQEALHRVASEEFAVILLEAQMPGLDGFQTVKLLHQHPRGRHVPVVFMSSRHDDMGAARKGYAAGGIDYIIKPFEPDLLRAKIDALVSLYRRGAELKRRAQIIAQKEIEAARAHAEAIRAEEAGRLKDRYIGILGHDLRNPLSAITNTAYLLLRSPDLDEKHHKSAARILRASERMAQMIRDVLDFTRGHLGGGIPVQPAHGDLGEICRRVVDETKAIHPHREIILDARGDLTGRWDSSRLEQVVSNLLGNAVHHGQGQILVEAVGEERQIVLRVRNGGPPIPADELTTLFEAFSQGPSQRRRSEGLGLGLYIVKEIVRAHGGSVEVRSSAAEGTTFACVWQRADDKRQGTA